MRSLFSNKVQLLSACILLLLAIISEQYFYVESYNYKDFVSSLEKNINSNYSQLKSNLDEIETQVQGKKLSPVYLTSLMDVDHDFEEKGYQIYIYEKDKLLFWSSNKVGGDYVLLQKAPDQSVIKLQNGWYMVVRPSKASTQSTYQVIGLVLIKNEYSYQNKYLTNKFNPSLNFPYEALLNSYKLPGYLDIRSPEGKYLCAIQFSGAFQSHPLHMISVILYLIAFSLLFFRFHLLYNKVARENAFGLFILMTLGLILLRMLFIGLHAPQSVYDLEIFKSFNEKGVFWSSLGDILINSLMLVYISITIFQNPHLLGNIFRWSRRNESGNYILLTGSFILIFIVALLSELLLRKIVLEKEINFDFDAVFTLDITVFFASVAVGCIYISIFLIAERSITFLSQLKVELQWFLLCILISAAFGLLVLQITKEFSTVPFSIASPIFTVLFILILWFVRNTNNNEISTTKLIGIMICFVLLLSVGAYHYEGIRENTHRIQMAEELSKNENFRAEQLFEEVRNTTVGDPVIISYFKDVTYRGINLENRIRQLYFSGFWSRFRIKVSAYDTSGRMLHSGSDETRSLGYYSNLIKYRGKATRVDYLYSMSSINARTSYMALVPVYSRFGGDTLSGTLVISLDSRLQQGEAGFTDLTSPSNDILRTQLSGYSYARYSKNFLISKNGDYPYFFSSAVFGRSASDNHFVVLDDYSHLLHKYGDNELLVLSIPNRSFTMFISNFSHAFLYFLVLLIVLSLVFRIPKAYYERGWDFKMRIQFSVVLMVVLSLVFVGVSTGLYIFNEYNKRQDVNLAKKLEAVDFHIDNILSGKDTANIDESMAVSLTEIANDLEIDFNIYNESGELLFTSQPKIYELGLLRPIIDPSAYMQLVYYKIPQLIQTENIGKLGFVSAYQPIRNSKNLLLGFLHLPYFKKQSELRSELSSFLGTLINVYVLLFLFALGLAYFISARITYPLRLVQKSLSRVKLGRPVEQIAWQNQGDEIGQLVAEYNRMVEEIAKSAQALAKTEREMAWREMAKQVAHEIKNPLTPMRLSIQHLQRASKDKVANLEDVQERINTTLLQQIDTLSAIATAFSNFAQMPKPQNEVVDLQEIVESTIVLYKQTENIEIFYDTKLTPPFYVYGDRDQLFRTFTNIVKNAIQAIPSKKLGIIRIEVLEDGGNYIIAISDNGSGISDELKSKIFLPNFTTKSTGTGLGLAIVKNMVEGMSGNLWFDSHLNVGTTFFVKLPKYVEPD